MADEKTAALKVMEPISKTHPQQGLKLWKACVVGAIGGVAYSAIVGTDPLGILTFTVVGAFLGAYGYTALKLYNDPSRIKRTASIVMTAGFGILLLIGIRRVYCKSKFHFME